MRHLLLTFILFCLTLVSLPSIADDTGRGELINRSCALCHAMYGQGAPGNQSPRLAGLPQWYLAKALDDYRKGARKNPSMVDVSHIDSMTDEDIEAVSRYLASQDIAADPAYDIRLESGDVEAGRKKFEDDCKTCHGRDGYGKKKKDAPPLAGQHSAYLFDSIHAFFHKERYHDNDPIDDTFDDMSDVQVGNVLAYLATLDNKRVKKDYHFEPAPMSSTATGPGAADKGDGFQLMGITQTVIMRRLEPQVNVSTAIEAMQAKARALDMPVEPGAAFVVTPAEQKERPPMVTVLQFCAPEQVLALMSASPVLANYGPCRVTLMHDDNGQDWLMAINLDMLIEDQQLPPKAQGIALQINQDILAIMAAGARGKVEGAGP